MKEILEKILKEEGYNPKRDEDNDIIVKYQGVTFVVLADSEFTFVRVWLPKFWSLESQEEFAKAHILANRLNKEYRVGKIIIDDDNDTNCFAEFFIDKADIQLKDIFLRMFVILFGMRLEFAQLMNADQQH